MFFGHLSRRLLSWQACGWEMNCHWPTCCPQLRRLEHEHTNMRKQVPVQIPPSCQASCSAQSTCTHITVLKVNSHIHSNRPMWQLGSMIKPQSGSMIKRSVQKHCTRFLDSYSELCTQKKKRARERPSSIATDLRTNSLHSPELGGRT